MHHIVFIDVCSRIVMKVITKRNGIEIDMPQISVLH